MPRFLASELPGPVPAVLALLVAATVALAWLVAGAPGFALALPGLGLRLAGDGVTGFFLLLLLVEAAARMVAGTAAARRGELLRLAGGVLLLAAADGLTLLAGAAIAMAGRARGGALLACLALLLALALLGGGDFAAMREAVLGDGALAAVTALAVLAAAARPGPLGPYLAMRLLFDLAGPLPAWGGAGVMLAGAGLAVVGLGRAMVGRGLAGVLADAGRGQAGLALLGLGMALSARADDLAVPLDLGLGVLWLAATIEAVSLPVWGVLARQGRGGFAGLAGMAGSAGGPALAALAAGLALAAVPPGAGFLVLWQALQAIPTLPVALVVGTSAALGATVAAGLGAATALRLVAAGFSDATPRPPPPPAAVNLVLALLGLLTLLAGLFPALVLRLADPATRLLGGGQSEAGAPSWSPWMLAALLAALAVLVVALARRGGAVGYRVIAAAPARDAAIPAAGLAAPRWTRRTLRTARGLAARLRPADPLAPQPALAAVLLAIVLLLAARALP